MMNILKSAVFASALLGAPAFAAAATLDFNGNICTPPSGSCSDGANIAQSYGDMAGVDVVWDVNAATTGNQGFFFWGPNYTGVTNVAYGFNSSNNSTALASISFVADTATGWG